MLAYIIPDVTTALTDHINRFGVVKRLIFHFENWNSKHITFLPNLPCGKQHKQSFLNLEKLGRTNSYKNSFVFYEY